MRDNVWKLIDGTNVCLSFQNLSSWRIDPPTRVYAHTDACMHKHPHGARWVRTLTIRTCECRVRAVHSKLSHRFKRFTQAKVPTKC